MITEHTDQQPQPAPHHQHPHPKAAAPAPQTLSQFLAAINHEHPAPHPSPPPKQRPRDTARAFLRCSRPLYSSQTTTHTPHTLVCSADPGPPKGTSTRPPHRWSAGTISEPTHPRTPPHRPPPPPTKGDDSSTGTDRARGPCCLRTQQCAMDHTPTGTDPTVPPPHRPAPPEEDTSAAAQVLKKNPTGTRGTAACSLTFHP